MLFDVKYLFAILFINLTIISAEESNYDLFSSWSDIDDYGCNCGSDKNGLAVDKVDDCCRIHKSCYNEINLRRNSCDAQKKIYSIFLNDNSINCDLNGDECQYGICECDKEAARCLKKYLGSLNPIFKSYGKDNCDKDAKKRSIEINSGSLALPPPICCPAGSMLNATGDGCNQCRPGTYSDEPCYRDPECQICESCKNCPPGYSCPGYGTITPIICPTGTMQNHVRDGCNACAAGTYADQPGYFDTSCIQCQTCRTCWPGYECPTPGTVIPIICPQGTMQAQNHTQCNLCLPGKYSDQPGYFDLHCTTCQSCKNCWPGYQCPIYGTTEPEVCPPGTMQAQDNTHCNLCLPGTYSDLPGYYDLTCVHCETCKRCLPGYYCPNYGTITPIICPAGSMVNEKKDGCNLCAPGTYSSVPGYYDPFCVDCKYCLNCAREHICPGPGQINPESCPAGTIPDDQAVACIPGVGQGFDNSN